MCWKSVSELSRPCCYGPCQMKITSGARTVFMINIAFCALIYAASFFEFEEPEPVAVITSNSILEGTQYFRHCFTLQSCLGP